tara:strand:- start:2591 stop:3871 length:1281 start_codon:yes stop_codon:yes gene_type:complete
MDEEFTSYRSAREAEIQNRLARFRYEREAELREQLENQYDSKKTDWSERLELEFQSREASARKAIMSEVDAGLRNERLTFETDLDLLKEETSLELEVDMEERLNAFRERKEEEVAVQLERQLDKREEIMRNKALIDVRKREAHIRAEIEAQLGLKRAEIRNRLQGLTEKMDAFKEMAEDKMRDAVTKQVQGEIDEEEETYQSRESEFRDLQSTDTRAEKRQMWMQSISGQNAPGQASTAMDPSALGARPNALGASAGRAMRGTMGAQAPQQPRMGLAGMRAPSTSSKPMTMPGAPLVKPIKSPLGATAPQLAQPVQPKVVRTPLQPANTLVQPNVMPQLEDVPLPAGEAIGAPVTTELPESTAELEAAVAQEIAPVQTEVADPVEQITEASSEDLEQEAEQESAVMRPIPLSCHLLNKLNQSRPPR